MAAYSVRNAPDMSYLDGVCQSDKRIGKGSYGVVFAGDWHGSTVAIKRYWPVLMRDETGSPSPDFQRFLSVFSMLRDHPHPNIIQVYGMVHPESKMDSPGLVMEMLPLTLHDRYGQSPMLTGEEEVRIALGVACGLKFLHGHGIIHRDVTTRNIMICINTGVVHAKITDFGGYRLLTSADSQECLSLNPGALVYMAPETRQCTASGGGKYGTPADCYSFGVALLAMVVRREPPSIWTLAESRDTDIKDMGSDHVLSSVVKQCLDDVPMNRPTSAHLCSQLGEELKTVCECGELQATVNDPNAALKADLALAKGRVVSLQQQLDMASVQREEASLAHRKLHQQVHDLTYKSAQQLTEIERLRSLVANRDAKIDQLAADRDNILSERDSTIVKCLVHDDQEQERSQHLSLVSVKCSAPEDTTPVPLEYSAPEDTIPACANEDTSPVACSMDQGTSSKSASPDLVSDGEESEAEKSVKVGWQCMSVAGPYGIPSMRPVLSQVDAVELNSNHEKLWSCLRRNGVIHPTYLLHGKLRNRVMQFSNSFMYSWCKFVFVNQHTAQINLLQASSM